MGEVSIRLFGKLEVSNGAGDSLIVSGKKLQALLAYLALNVDQHPTRDRLAGLLWGDRFDEQARQSLRQSISRLRKILVNGETPVLLTDGDHVGLCPEAVDVDARNFEHHTSKRSPEALTKAAQLYAGTLVEGLQIKEAAFDDWIRSERARFRDAAGEVLLQLAAHQVETADTNAAIETAKRLIALDPMSEEGHRLLMCAYAAGGQRAAALKQYKACAAILLAELGIQPDPVTQQLNKDIRSANTEPVSSSNIGPAQKAGIPHQKIQFCTAQDSVGIAYATTGQGTPVVKAANWLNHLEHDWNSPVWRHLISALSQDHLLVRYDERGTGLSDWEVDDQSFESWVRDLETVVEAVGLERFALLGISQGCAVSIAYAARNPDRVTHLVLHGGYARGWRIGTSPEIIKKQEAMLTLIREGWGQNNPAFRQMFTSLIIPDANDEQVKWFNELARISASPENAVRLFDEFGHIDVTDLLPEVHVPTLVLHSRNDSRIPFESGRELATSIPNARFVPLEGRNHLILEQQDASKRFLAEICQFLSTNIG